MKFILVTLFLPIGATLVLLGVALWLVLRPPSVNYIRRGFLAGIILASLSILYLSATPLVGRALSVMLYEQVRGRQVDNPQNANAIIVLTAGITNTGALGWIPRPDTIHRMAVAYELQRLVNLRMPVIVSGGHTRGVQNPSEAAVAAEFFAHHRTELTPTELEQVSTDTYESAMQLAPVLARREAKTVFLVTNQQHMLRALATFRARGIDAIPFPAMTVPENLGIAALRPSVVGLGMTTDALYEIYGLLGYLLTGKISWQDITYN